MGSTNSRNYVFIKLTSGLQLRYDLHSSRYYVFIKQYTQQEIIKIYTVVDINKISKSTQPRLFSLKLC